jgi:hypothetical protein
VQVFKFTDRENRQLPAIHRHGSGPRCHHARQLIASLRPWLLRTDP